MVGVGSRHTQALPLALAATLVLMSGDDARAETATSTLTISLRAEARCTIGSMSALSFGQLRVGSQRDATTNLAVTCSGDVPMMIALDAGAHPLPGSSADLPRRSVVSDEGEWLEYQLYRDASHRLVWGSAEQVALALKGSPTTVTVPVYGRVSGGPVRAPGRYQDTVFVTVSY